LSAFRSRNGIVPALKPGVTGNRFHLFFNRQQMAATYSTLDDLHQCLTREFGLVAEAPHGGSWRTYFFGRVEWHPSRSTRTVKVLLDAAGRPWKIQLCVSSDNNNSVFLAAPFGHPALKQAIDGEIRQLARDPQR
jgi:hypothetical protein